MRVTWHIALLSAGLVTTGLFACKEDELQGAKAEVTKSTVKLDMPPVPAFDMPQANADGTHSVREMRLKGRKLIDTEVQVKGYITWIYDCAAEMRKPGMSDKDVAKAIETDPSRCNRPHLYLGDNANTPEDQSLWVVEVDRELREDERKGLSKDDLAKIAPVPVYKLGDEVLVVGEWKQTSPHGFAKSDGLLVYKCMKNLTSAWPTDAMKKDAKHGLPEEWPAACKN
jgi:hypothetical protein